MALKKGDKINPLGPLPIGEDLKLARKLTRVEFERVANKYLYMNFFDIQKAMNPENKMNIPVLDYMILSVMYHAIKEGDQKRLDFLLDRTIGQAVKRIQVTTEPEDMDKNAPVELSAEERIEMAERYKNKIIEIEARKVSQDANIIDRKDESEV